MSTHLQTKGDWVEEQKERLLKEFREYISSRLEQDDDTELEYIMNFDEFVDLEYEKVCEPE